jgi:hypothetical protein
LTKYFFVASWKFLPIGVAGVYVFFILLGAASPVKSYFYRLNAEIEINEVLIF